MFLPGESQGQGSLVGCHLWGRTESDTTEVTQQQQHIYIKATKETDFVLLLHSLSHEESVETRGLQLHGGDSGSC